MDSFVEEVQRLVVTDGNADKDNYTAAKVMQALEEVLEWAATV
jgi:hypothetical protein